MLAGPAARAPSALKRGLEWVEGPVVTSIVDQYRIISTAAGWIDRSGRGRLRFSGADARSFLQGLLTNDVSALTSGRAVYAAYLTPQGRMVADITLIEHGGDIIGLVADGQGAALATRFDLLIFTEAVTVTDVSGEFAEIEISGGEAASIVATAMGTTPESVAALANLGRVDTPGGLVLRDDAAPFPTFRLLVAPDARDRIVAAVEAAGAIGMSEEMATALRIEAGRGAWGHDLGEDVIPLEAGLLDRAVSTSKGCYVGQEIVIRILHRGGGRVAKRLVTMDFDPSLAEAPTPKAELASGDAVVGHLTSVAFSPARGAFVALGYLRREAAEVGREVTVAGTDATARVTGFAS